MDYRLIRSRRRTLALEVTPEGEVLVRAPQRMPMEEITRFFEAKQAWLARSLRRVEERRLAHPEPTAEERQELLRRARVLLPPLVAHYAEQMQVQPAGITITGARKRFGSCSAKNRLCFSLYLMQWEREAIEYVVVHELAHIRQKNHSPAFYAEVERILPDYRQREKLLKE